MTVYSEYFRIVCRALEMLTYERLLARTSTLLDMAANEIEGDRRRLLQTAMNSLIISAELGLEGDQEVLSPDQLKHWFEWEIKAIHEPFDGPVQGEDTPVPKRRMIAQTAASASHKRQQVATAEEQDIVAALLQLACPPNPISAHESITARRIAQGRNTYTAFPAVDRISGPKETFLAGVQYALRNIAAVRHGVFDETDFWQYVSAELDLGGHRFC